MPDKYNVLMLSSNKTLHKNVKSNKAVSMGAGSPFLLNNVKNNLIGGKIKPLVFSKKNIKPINFLI